VDVTHMPLNMLTGHYALGHTASAIESPVQRAHRSIYHWVFHCPHMTSI